MNKQIIHFAHANGFPARTYSKLFSFLEEDFEINFLEKHGHDPEFPVTDGWRFLKQELRRELKRRYSHKIIGVGHSFGGILHLMLAAEEPSLYSQIVLLDAPVISPLSSFGIKILKKIGLSDKFSHARRTASRRDFWQNRTEALEHFKGKEIFRNFDPDALRDYIRYGTVENGEGVRLFFRPAIEAQIYKTLPDFLPKLRSRIKVPVAYVGGDSSDEARWARIGFMRRKFAFEFHFLEGSHLFPFEKPQETARIIREILNDTKNRI